jgi:deoxyguanosine kinase
MTIEGKHYDINVPFIAIEGNIGAGKTTLSQRLARDLDARLILEQFTDNPFLPFFYENPERYAFPVELFFMTERHKQLQEAFSNTNLFQQVTISDYFFLKTLLFAKNNLNTDEYRLFKRLFNTLNNTFAKPDLLIYLHRPVETLVQQIEQRGRSFEAQIKTEYLETLQKAYFDYFETQPQFPILVIHATDQDFKDSSVHYHWLLKQLETNYEPGIYHLQPDERSATNLT